MAKMNSNICVLSFNGTELLAIILLIELAISVYIVYKKVRERP